MANTTTVDDVISCTSGWENAPGYVSGVLQIAFGITAPIIWSVKRNPLIMISISIVVGCAIMIPLGLYFAAITGLDGLPRSSSTHASYAMGFFGTHIIHTQVETTLYIERLAHLNVRSTNHQRLNRFLIIYFNVLYIVTGVFTIGNAAESWCMSPTGSLEGGGSWWYTATLVMFAIIEVTGAICVALSLRYIFYTRRKLKKYPALKNPLRIVYIMFGCISITIVESSIYTIVAWTSWAGTVTSDGDSMIMANTTANLTTAATAWTRDLPHDSSNVAWVAWMLPTVLQLVNIPTSIVASTVILFRLIRRDQLNIKLPCFSRNAVVSFMGTKRTSTVASLRPRMSTRRKSAIMMAPLPPHSSTKRKSTVTPLKDLNGKSPGSPP